MRSERALQQLNQLASRVAGTPAIDVFVERAVQPFQAAKYVPGPILQQVLGKLRAALRSSLDHVAPVHWLDPEHAAVKKVDRYEQRGRSMLAAWVEELWKFEADKLYLPAARASIPAAYLRDFAAASSQHIQQIREALLEGVAVALRGYYEHGQQQGSRRARELLAEPAVARAVEPSSAELWTYKVEVRAAPPSHLRLEWELRARLS